MDTVLVCTELYVGILDVGECCVWDWLGDDVVVTNDVEED